MKALDRDLRERIVRAVERGEPMPRVAARFEVGYSTVKKLKYRHRDTGSTEPLTSRCGRKRIIGPEQGERLAELAAAGGRTLEQGVEVRAGGGEHEVGAMGALAGGREERPLEVGAEHPRDGLVREGLAGAPHPFEGGDGVGQGRRDDGRLDAGDAARRESREQRAPPALVGRRDVDAERPVDLQVEHPGGQDAVDDVVVHALIARRRTDAIDPPRDDIEHDGADEGSPDERPGGAQTHHSPCPAGLPANVVR